MGTQALAEEMPLALAIEVAEWYFRSHMKGKRGRGSAGKLPVFGILKRGGHVYNQVIPDPKATTLLGIRRKWDGAGLSCLYPYRSIL